jgi:hypothetical protein
MRGKVLRLMKKVWDKQTPGDTPLLKGSDAQVREHALLFSVALSQQLPCLVFQVYLHGR